MILQRILAVISAMFLVGTVALATLGPGTVSLGRALMSFDRGWPEAVHDWLVRGPGDWAWTAIALPLLVRPVWLVPAALGLICLGLTLSVSNRKSAHRSHRRS